MAFLLTGWVEAQPRSPTDTAPRTSAATLPAAASSHDLRRRLAAIPTNAAIADGSRTSVAFLLDVVDRNAESFADQSLAWRRIAQRYVESLERGVDPYPREQNIITNRGYVSPISETRQGYAIYLPPNYDPNRAYPLLVALHGGSSNGNLFLGVVLGNNMDWETYAQHLWDVYRPGWSPDWIVVAPDGFGQVLWRWMGEEDVLAVIDDVKRHYNVDPNRVVLSGLSNGGIGAYAIGMRHAWQFSMVIAMAGAPSWFQYTGGRPSPIERRALMQVSAMHLSHNSVNTDFRFFHGRVDPGPMRPAFVTEMENFMRGQGLTPNVTWFDMGHDLLYVVHRHGRAYAGWGQVVRNPHPSEVRVVTADYRASRQHWAEVSRIDGYPSLASVRAVVGALGIQVTTDRVLEFSLRLDDAPLAQVGGDSGTLHVTIDGQSPLMVPRSGTATFSRNSLQSAFVAGRLAAAAIEKVPGMSGPLTDAYRDRSIHVYGTQIAAQTQALRQAAERGARGWPLWLWNHNQRVVADSEVTQEMIDGAHLVLYGTPNSNAVLNRIAPQLPIRIESGGIRVGERLYAGREVGTRFIYPNPLAHHRRYVVVQGAPTPEGVARGHNLPDFVGDFVVYDARSAARRERLISARSGHLASGYFDRFWQLMQSDGAPNTASAATLRKNTSKQDTSAQTRNPERGAARTQTKTRPVSAEQLEINRILGMRPSYRLPEEVRRQTPAYAMPITPPPANPTLPQESDYRAPVNSVEGRIARQIARNAQSFLNFRAIIPGATWTEDETHVMRIRARRECEQDLRTQNIMFDSIAPEELAEALAPLNDGVAPPRPMVPVPVRLRGPVAGVTYHSARGPIVVACELAARLPALSRILLAHNIHRAGIASAYRSTPMQSYHTMGLALDIGQFVRSDGTRLSVLQHFAETPAHPTCGAPEPPDDNARELLAIACEVAESHVFNSVLTPNYNDGHRDHFHVDVRPDDPRYYLR